MKKLLTLDLSSASTGYAIFDITTYCLTEYGNFTPNNSGLSKLSYPEMQIKRIRSIVIQVINLINKENPDVIYIEEINRGIGRLSQKVLDMVHGILLDRIDDKYLKKIIYINSDSSDGWRYLLGLNLSQTDKLHNKEAKILNKKIKKKIPIITKKHLAMRLVNKYYGLNFDVDAREKDSDICDAIGIGHAVLHKIIKRLNF